jgi:UDP-N-acetylmuramoylalanine-D-glutamate ligase
VTGLARRFSDWARQRFQAARDAGEIRRLDVDDFLLVAASPSAWLAKALVPTAASRQIEIANAIADFMRLGLAPLPEKAT